MKVKSGEMIKSPEFLSYNKCFFGFRQILFNLTHRSAEHREKSFVPAFFKVSFDHVFDNLESGKKELLFWKKVWKKSWILDPEICTNPGILG